MGMKKLFAGILTLSLVLAACGNDDNKKEDDQKDKDKTTEQSDNSKKDSNKDQSKENKNSKDSKDSKDSASSSTASDSSSSNNQGTNATGDQSSDNSNNAANNNASSQSNNNQALNNGTNANGQATQQTGYVAPYQGQNAVPAASSLGQVPADQNSLKVLPNFPQSLATAQAEADAINGPHTYNDYGIQNDGNGKYSYLFSFANQNNPGTFIIVSVNQRGQASVLDPAYAG